MKKEIAGKIILCLLCVFGIVIADIACIRCVSTKSINLLEIPVAAHDIDPRTRIDESDIKFIAVPNAYLMDNAFRTKEEVVGKYTEIQGAIPKGSPFYKSMLFEEAELPDHCVLQLENGEAVYSFHGDNGTFSSLTAGLRVDVHITISMNNAPAITGILLEHARILALKDHQGTDVKSRDSSGVPYIIEIAVQKTDLDLMTLAETTGELRFFASSDSYQDEEAVLCAESAAVQYLETLQMTPQIEMISTNS